MNPGPEHLKTSLIDREPMRIELTGNMFSEGISMRETQIPDPKTSKTHWSTRNEWESSSRETSPVLSIKSTAEVPYSVSI